MLLLLSGPHWLQDILKHVSKREFEELMCADQLTRERHKRKAFLNFSEFQFTIGLCFILKTINNRQLFFKRLLLFHNRKGLDEQINTELFNSDSAVPLLSSLCVLSLFAMVKRKRRLLFHPPTVMNGALGTATCGKSTRHQEWVRKTGCCLHKNSFSHTTDLLKAHTITQ